MPSTRGEWVLLDAGVLIGALLVGDPRHAEARPLVEAARSGELRGCVTPGILSEVYAALTWIQAQPPHSPEHAASAVRALIEPPSAIRVLPENKASALTALDLAVAHDLTARRIHDARHAAAALRAGVTRVRTYDVNDWQVFVADGMRVLALPSNHDSAPAA